VRSVQSVQIGGSFGGRLVSCYPVIR